MRNFDAAFNPTSRMPFAHQASIRNISTNGKLLHRPLDCLLSYQLWTRPLTSELHNINVFTISLPSLYHIPDSVTGIALTKRVPPLPDGLANPPVRPAGSPIAPRAIIDKAARILPNTWNSKWQNRQSVGLEWNDSKRLR